MKKTHWLIFQRQCWKKAKQLANDFWMNQFQEDRVEPLKISNSGGDSEG